MKNKLHKMELIDGAGGTSENVMFNRGAYGNEWGIGFGGGKLLSDCIARGLALSALHGTTIAIQTPTVFGDCNDFGVGEG